MNALTPSSVFKLSACALALTAAIASTHSFAQARPVLVDRIVAVVNDEVITRHELNVQKRAVIGQLKRQGVAAPTASELDAQVLERFINERVQLQHARENGIRVDDETVSAALQNIAKQNKMSMQQFSDEWIFVSNSAPGAKNALSSESEITKDLSQVMLLYGGVIVPIKDGSTTVTPLLSTGASSGDRGRSAGTGRSTRCSHRPSGSRASSPGTKRPTAFPLCSPATRSR